MSSILRSEGESFYQFLLPFIYFNDYTKERNSVDFKHYVLNKLWLQRWVGTTELLEILHSSSPFFQPSMKKLRFTQAQYGSHMS